jgi:hypothetical protein
MPANIAALSQSVAMLSSQQATHAKLASRSLFASSLELPAHRPSSTQIREVAPSRRPICQIASANRPSRAAAPRSNGWILEGGIYTHLLLPFSLLNHCTKICQASRPLESPQEHKICKISSLTQPKLLIFGDSKEKTLIYILTEAIYIPPSYA